MRKWLNDFRFWLVVFFLLQLPFITQPPIDKSHTWRQTLTMTVARNMAQGEGTMLYPRIDHNGDSDGIIGMEFPVYNAAIAGMIRVFGFQHWYGRLINLLVSLIGVFCFTRLVEVLTDRKTAFWSGIFLLFSLWFMFMRKIMPDTFSVALVLTGVWLGWRYTRNGRIYDLAGYFVLVSLGLLAKIPASVVLAPFIMVLYARQIPYARKALITGATFTAISLVAVWYFYWVPYLVATYEYPLYFTRDLVTGIIELSLEKELIVNQFVFHSFYSYLGFGLFLSGLFLAAYRKEKHLILAGVIGFGVFLFFTIKTGMVFPKHNYYMVPVLPIMAAFTGYAAAHFPWQKVKPVLIALVLIESGANMQHDLQDKNRWYTGLEAIMDRISDRQELVVTNGGTGPQVMYFMNRKGWTLRTQDLTDTRIEQYTTRGAKWLVLIRPFDEFDPDRWGSEVYRDEHIVIYRLSPEHSPWGTNS